MVPVIYCHLENQPQSWWLETTVAVGFAKGSAVWVELSKDGLLLFDAISPRVALLGTGHLFLWWPWRQAGPGSCPGAPLGQLAEGLGSSPCGLLHRLAWASVQHGGWFPEVNDPRDRKWTLSVLKYGPRICTV